MLWSIDSCQNKVSADQYRGLRCRPIEVKCFLKLSAAKLIVFKWSQAQVQFFLKFIWNMLCLCAAQLKFWFDWPRTRKFSQLLQAGKTVAFDFDHHGHALVTRWSRSTSNFYALIGQDLTGELMRKIYAASWILFTLTARSEERRVGKECRSRWSPYH